MGYRAVDMAMISALKTSKLCCAVGISFLYVGTHIEACGNDSMVRQEAHYQVSWICMLTRLACSPDPSLKCWRQRTMRY